MAFPRFVLGGRARCVALTHCRKTDLVVPAFVGMSKEAR
jgi:hypothetical protein